MFFSNIMYKLLVILFVVKLYVANSVFKSKILLFPKIVYGFQPLTIFAKSSILDVRLGSEYASALINDLEWNRANTDWNNE